MKLGLIGSMPEDMERILKTLGNKQIYERGNRVFYKGTLLGVPVVAVFSRWGKVAAAATATNLIVEYGVDQIFFTGVASALSADLHVGDVVVAQRFFQHDMDARPRMRRFEIPLTGKTSFEITERQQEMARQSVYNFLKNAKDFRAALAENYIDQPHLLVGDIASGDLYLSTQDMCKALNRNLPSVLCADMESAAVAQVCDDYGIPLCVAMVISNGFEEKHADVAREFVERHSADYSLAIVSEYAALLQLAGLV